MLHMECRDYIVYFGEEYRSENGFGLAIVDRVSTTLLVTEILSKALEYAPLF